MLYTELSAGAGVLLFDDNKCRGAGATRAVSSVATQAREAALALADYFRLLKDDCRCRGLCRMMAFHPASIQGGWNGSTLFFIAA